MALSTALKEPLLRAVHFVLEMHAQAISLTQEITVSGNSTKCRALLQAHVMYACMYVYIFSPTSLKYLLAKLHGISHTRLTLCTQCSGYLLLHNKLP